MISNQDLAQVLRHQEQLRREAARERLAARSHRQENEKARTRRVFGLRLNPA
jgi:hypothetical protein